MKAALKAVLFDLDGTLFNTEVQYTEIWHRIGQQYLPHIPTFAHDIKGTTLKQILQRYFPNPVHQKQIVDQLNAWESQMHYEFFPGVLPFLHDLRDHDVRLAVVTSSSSSKMAQVERQMPQFATYFDKVLTAECFKASKPDPDCYLLGAKVFNCDVSQCVVFEDAPSGLQAGMAAGIFTIGVAISNPPALVRPRCNQMITSFEGMSYERLLALRDAE